MGFARLTLLKCYILGKFKRRLRLQKKCIAGKRAKAKRCECVTPGVTQAKRKIGKRMPRGDGGDDL